MRQLFKIATLVGGIAAAGTALTLSSCKEDFLEVEPTGVLSESVVESRAGILNLLIGTYGQLNGRSNRLGSTDNWVHGSIRSGEATKGTDPGDFAAINPVQRFELQSTDGAPADMWSGNFNGVVRANQAIRIATNSADPTVDEAFRAVAVAEARFLRGHYYFNLARGFNKVPFIPAELTDANEISAIVNTTVWDKVEEDFIAAVAGLPEAQPAVGRANKWAAKAYLGKVQLYLGKFAEARATFEDVIANGVTSDGQSYALLPEYSQAFNAEFDNSSESVFAIQAAANTGSTNNANPQWDLNYPHNTGAGGPGNCCGFFQPTFELASSFRTNAQGLPLLDGSYKTAENEIKTDMGKASDDPSYVEDPGNLDPRIDHSIGRRGIPFLDWGPHPGQSWIRNQPNGGPFSPKKFIYYKSQENTLSDGSGWTRGYSSMNYNIIRFADVLLMAAEAHIEDATTGSLERARELINLVRDRAADSFVFEDDGVTAAAKYVIGTYDAAFANQAAARTALRFERKLELSGEGHRFFDLVRWGVAAAEVNAYLSYESAGSKLGGALGGASFRAGIDEYYPIPQVQIDQTNGVLTQNPGF